jgi:bifunctional DNA-binding transcriptional regulator/antitoxin component of YhaV-PrlF toxin-antitoxin module
MYAMEDTQKAAFTVTRVSATGEITIPPEYRTTENLEPGTPLIAVQVGDALVLAPLDEQLAAVTGRLEAAMKAAGQSIEDLVQAAASARAEIVESEFGHKGGQ